MTVVFFLQQKTQNDPKFHGKYDAWKAVNAASMKFFRVVLYFSLFKKTFSVTSFTDVLLAKFQETSIPGTHRAWIFQMKAVVKQA